MALQNSYMKESRNSLSTSAKEDEVVRMIALCSIYVLFMHATALLDFSRWKVSTSERIQQVNFHSMKIHHREILG